MRRIPKPRKNRPCQRSYEDHSLQKNRVRKHCPSEPWVDAVVNEGATYPPEADTTPMRPCNSRSCKGKCYPHYYVVNERCYECQLESFLRKHDDKFDGKAKSPDILPCYPDEIDDIPDPEEKAGGSTSIVRM